MGRSPRELRLRRQRVFRSWRRSLKAVSGGLWRRVAEPDSAVPGLVVATPAVVSRWAVNSD
ncbi:MAG: hypothetical protein M3Y73_03910 [Actinomycetota bacterium]|nr:hypothetical protein [Actinomycetota bacterium]